MQGGADSNGRTAATPSCSSRERSCPCRPAASGNVKPTSKSSRPGTRSRWLTAPLSCTPPHWQSTKAQAGHHGGPNKAAAASGGTGGAIKSGRRRNGWLCMQVRGRYLDAGDHGDSTARRPEAGGGGWEEQVGKEAAEGDGFPGSGLPANIHTRQQLKFRPPALRHAPRDSTTVQAHRTGGKRLLCMEIL